MGHSQAQEPSELLAENGEERLETETSKNCNIDEKLNTAKPHKCTFEGCDRTYKKRNRLEEHFRMHTGERPFKCLFEGCGKTYITIAHFKRHIDKMVHPQPDPPPHTKLPSTLSSQIELPLEDKEQEEAKRCQNSQTEIKPPSRKIHKCPNEGCERTFTKKMRLDEHIRQHNGERPFACTHEGCNKAYTSSSHLKRHLKESHEAVAKFLICTKCSLTLSSRESLRKHVQRHHTPNKLRCSDCDLWFRKKNNLAEHMTLVHNRGTLDCDKCSKKFHSSFLLAKHQRQHEKTYPCTEPGCDMVFKKFIELRRHTKTHVREYKCTECEKVFAAKCLLRSHMKAHTNLLIPCPYDHCHKTFSWQRNLDSHIRSVHMNIKAYCDICKAGFSSKATIPRHIQVVHMGKVNPRATKKKDRKKRKDAGEFKKSMVSKLSGVELSYQEELALLKRVPEISGTDSEFPTVEGNKPEVPLITIDENQHEGMNMGDAENGDN